MSTVYGYCRISTPKQDISRQIRNIRDKYPDAHIISEAFTGTKIDRPEFSKLLKNVRSGDTIVFDEASRMARNADEGVRLYIELFNKGITLIFLKDPYINTEVYRKQLETTIAKVTTGKQSTDKLINGIMDNIKEYMDGLAEEQIRIAFAKAQQEIDYLHKRTSEGLLTAKLNGKRVGRQLGETVETRKAQAAKEIILKHSRDFGGSLSDTEVRKLAGVSRNSYYKYKAALKAVAS